MTRDIEILRVHRETAFTFDARGRMLHDSAPDRSAGKRFSFTGCREGNMAVVRHDVPEPVARELERLVAIEPPLADDDSVPLHLETYRALLDVDGDAGVEHHHGLLWLFPGPLTIDIDIDIDIDLVWSGTHAGDGLLGRFSEVISAGLGDMGFRTAADLWEPWCVAVVDGEIVSIAETVRTGPRGAEVGVDTAAGFRGLGLGATATAGWSRHEALAHLMLFYSTGRENRSSRRLTERLELRLLGSTFAVA